MTGTVAKVTVPLFYARGLFCYKRAARLRLARPA
jgi:hypothetical protein